ncbi:MAG: hypothetical protein COZ34_02290 [Candidatus Pacebacteria bacterium CG_4_10_14_3_um_filter_34_15]|nr:hypothetical protein [Candidatus Paceibacterota bacterium]OIO44585.1 MAG: hypothetical protein AUJ41_02420 [Candidatus Pacebacteria bacterium CG1_02_43_31]PIQ80697.1 MAG: hypothetical protein COV78_04100 [Candidatus Pacebacteria bacterium CG11_big_fil_rev_8_21_14_0_20_34_55]PIX81626.1 MAG: hypothetical protein COZ34_02290 [Candidatus Pacebacteria bacterium CG_4_10_14_3_um_filter_34_15]PJC43555.1 MAG: hypothetical protein CO039_03440 [Candidatus Pacebacteria bacterium CG_4_9_14_0_2_um_filter_
MKTSLPTNVTKYFWGDDLAQLSWEKHQKYIMQTLLEKGNQESISWLFSKMNKQNILKQILELKLSPKSKNFWKIYLS